MRIEALPLAGLVGIHPDVHHDPRGLVVEFYQQGRYQAAGITPPITQINRTRSVQGVLRGLHWQQPPGQAKLFSVVTGTVYDVWVDLRQGSVSCAQWYGLWLDGEQGTQVYAPEGFAHGFCVTSPTADVVYALSRPYDPHTERTLRFDDPALGIPWPVQNPVLSDRDRRGEPLKDCLKDWGAKG